MTIYRYTAVSACQATGSTVFSFAASPEEILAFAQIERVGRDASGALRGFQRHQVASHIKEIRDYLARDDAILPNPIVVAFTDGVKVERREDGLLNVEIDATNIPGYVVDGQQRLSAFAGVSRPGFQVFVSAMICRDYNELRQQFVLINNTRPLPKALIYELLPTVEGLPHRFTARSFASAMVERLNYDDESSLRGQIYQHTNPQGVVRDSAIQRIVMNSSSDGFIRQLVNEPDYVERTFHVLSNYFGAIQAVFRSDWVGMSPKTSRLVHGAGIVAMGYVMELLHTRTGAASQIEFEGGLERLVGKTAWTKGKWKLGDNDERPWNGIQNTPGDISLLANYLVREIKMALRSDGVSRQVARAA